MKVGDYLPWILLVLGLMVTPELVDGQVKVPEFPDYNILDSTGFQSQVEFTTRDGEKSHTLFVDEYHDLDGRRGRVEIDYIDKSSVYYFSNMNEAVTITYAGKPTCTVYTLDTLPLLQIETMWGWLDVKHKIVGPSSILFRKTKKPPVYVKEGQVRGIKVDVFQAEDTVDDVVITYYIASNDLQQNTSLRLPIRVMAVGNTGIDKQGNSTITSYMNMTLDFLQFKTNLSSQYIFRIPTGIGCSGLRVPNDQTLPAIEEQYSFVVESYDMEETTQTVQTNVFLNKVWYDSLNGLFRMDALGTTQIDDYRTGVSYVINPNDSCIIGPILNSKSERTTSLVGAMKDPKKFIELDGDYYYIGRDIYRSIYCDIWETVKYNQSGFPSTMIYTYYFMVSKIEAITEGDRNFQPPVALILTGYNDKNTPDLHIVYNYFAFDQSDGRIFNDIMNVGKCFPSPTQRKKFSILFEPDPPQNVSLEFLHDFFLSLQTQALLQVAEGASASIIRFPFYELLPEDTGMRAVFELVDSPPILARFYNEAKQTLPGVDMQRVKSVDNTEECAKQCLETSEPTCNSFQVCGRECYVGEYDGSEDWKDVGTGKSNCDLFIRSVQPTTLSLKDLEINDALVTLKDSINNGRVVIGAQSQSGKTVDFVAKSFEEIRFAPNTIEFELVANQRQVAVSETTIELDSGSASTLQECHRLCKTESRMACTSFSFCPTTRVCRISSLYLNSGSKVDANEMEKATQCMVYRVTPLALFEMTPGKVPLFSGDKSITGPGMDNVEKCAARCQTENSINCRGFEYCQDSKTCSLHKVHVLDMSIGAIINASANCTHYSKKYSSEFTNVGHMLIQDPLARQLDYVSLEECAKSCYRHPPGYPCRSFNFDAEPGLATDFDKVVLSKCFLNTVSFIDAGVQLVANKTFALYTLNDLEPKNNTKPTPSPTGDPVYVGIKDVLLAGEYEVRVEYMRKKEGLTFFVNEYHNVIKKETRLDYTQFDSGTKNSYYFFSGTQQVAAIRNGKCDVFSMRQAIAPEGGLEWGWLDLKRLIIGPSTVLWRDTYDKPKFIGTRTVRGKLCNVFVAKDQVDRGVDITIYVPANDWATASGTQYEFPTRVYVNGSYVLGNETLEVDIQYDFIYFRSRFIASKDNLMIPKGLGCKDLQSRDARVMPELEPMYSFVAEKYNFFEGENNLTSYIDLNRIWYDEPSGIVMKEYHDKKTRVQVKEVNDFNTGISYNFVNEKCTIGHVKLSDSFVNQGRSQPSNAIKSARQFLDLDGTYYYLGDEMWRDINCEVWETIKENVQEDNITLNRVVITFYLTTDKYKTGREQVLLSRIPVRKLVSIQPIASGETIQIEYNIFNYDDYRTKTGVKMDIPIDQCFIRPEQRKYFTIFYEIPDPDKTTIIDPKIGISTDFPNLVAYAANVSTIRVPPTEIVRQGDQILVNGLIVDKSPLLAQFYNYQKDVPALRKTVKITGIKDMEICAAFCLNQNHIKNCKSFTYCKTKDVPDCFVSTMDAYDVRNVTVEPDDNKNCQLFIRGNMNTSDFGVPLEKAVENLENSNVKLQLELRAGQKTLYLIPTKIIIKDAPFVGKQPYELIKTKTRLSKKGKSVIAITKPTGSAEECYAECVKTSITACSSFSYCYNGESRCLVTSVYFKSDWSNPETEKDQTEYDDSCNLYSLKAIQFFEESKGKVPNIRGNRVLPEVKTPDECAVACKNEQKFKCEGLEYCQVSHTCVLMDTHVLDVSESSTVSTSEFCTHYSLSYAFEFEDVGQLELRDPSATVVTKVNFQECARLCKTNPGLKCRSINFCQAKDKDSKDEVVECVLNTLTIFDTINVTKHQDGSDRSCHHFTFLGVETATNDTKPVTTTVKPTAIIPTEKPDPIDDIFPEITELFFQEYEVESEIVDRVVNKTKHIAEYHDVRGKRGRIETITSDYASRFAEYYTSDLDKVIVIKNGNCNVQNYTEESWGWTNKKNLISGPSAMLFRETNEAPSYLEQTFIRGILCNRFTARDKTDNGVTLNFYFSATKWAAGPLPIPVRITAKGAYKQSSIDTKVDVQVDFIKFQPRARRDDTFVIPQGYGCEGLKQTGPRKMPPIQQQISYSSEIYLSMRNEPLVMSEVIRSRTYYDGLNKLYKTEGVEEKSNVWEVMDFNTGVSYQVKRGECVGIQPIESTLFNDGIRGSVKEMKTAQKFLGLDGDFYYLGREYYRGVACDLWETTKNDFFFMGTRTNRAVITAYFMSPTYLPTMEGDSNIQVPVSIVYKLWSTEPITEVPTPTWRMDFFDFDQAEGRVFYDHMDIEPCMEQEQKMHFLVYFTSNSTISRIAETHDKEFRVYALLKIAESAKVNLLRIKLKNVSYNKNNIAVKGMFLGRPPFRRGFVLYGVDETPTNDQKLLEGISDPEICAQKCMEEEDLFCKGFTICNNDLKKSACFLSAKDKSDKNWGGIVPEYQQCQLYFRTTASSKPDEVSLETAMDNLNQYISDGKLTVTIDKMVITAKSLDTRVTPIGFDDDINYEYVFQDRKLSKASQTTIDLGLNSVGSAIECYDKCVTESRLECVSFSFCDADHSCRLSSVFIVGTQNSSSLEELEPGKATHCGIYRRNAIKLFTELPGRPSLGKGDKTLISSSAEECALQCKKESSFKCLGFEFCGDTDNCVMHKTHLYDLPITTKRAPVCTYYAAKYSTEFADLGRFVLIEPKTSEENGVTFEECAKLCVDAGSNCRSINYCPDMKSLSTSRCDLNTLSDQDEGAVLVEAQTCSYYFKRNLNDRIRRPEPLDSSVGLVSSGKFTGISFILIFVGIGLGIAGYVAAAWYKKNRQNPGNVRFVNTHVELTESTS